MDLVEVLSFLFMLSTMELGRVRTFQAPLRLGTLIGVTLRSIQQRTLARRSVRCLRICAITA